jgi:hypothetical protein
LWRRSLIRGLQLAARSFLPEMPGGVKRENK